MSEATTRQTHISQLLTMDFLCKYCAQIIKVICENGMKLPGESVAAKLSVEVTYSEEHNTVLDKAQRITSEAAHLRKIAASLRSDARLTRELAQTLRDL